MRMKTRLGAICAGLALSASPAGAEQYNVIASAGNNGDSHTSNSDPDAFADFSRTELGGEENYTASANANGGSLHASAARAGALSPATVTTRSAARIEETIHIDEAAERPGHDHGEHRGRPRGDRRRGVRVRLLLARSRRGNRKLPGRGPGAQRAGPPGPLLLLRPGRLLWGRQRLDHAHAAAAPGPPVPDRHRGPGRRQLRERDGGLRGRRPRVRRSGPARARAAGHRARPQHRLRGARPAAGPQLHGEHDQLPGARPEPAAPLLLGLGAVASAARARAAGAPSAAASARRGSSTRRTRRRRDAGGAAPRRGRRRAGTR